MIRSIRCKKIAAYPVGCDPVEAVSQYPVAEFKLDRCIIDYEIGEEMDAVLPAANAKYAQVRGVWSQFGANQPRHTGTALLFEGGGTNKCQCQKINPTETSGVNPSSGTVVIEDDAVALTAKNYSKFGPSVFAFDNTGGGSSVDVLIAGNTLNTNKHAVSVVARTIGAASRLSLSGGEGDMEFTNSEYKYICLENVSPASNFRSFRLRVGAGAKLYFIVPQLEEGMHCTSPMVGDNSAAAAVRATEAGSATNGISYDESLNTEARATLTDEGRIRFVFTPKWDKGDVSGAFGLITTTTGASSVLYVDASGNICSTDGTNTVTNTTSYSADDELAVDVAWGDALSVTVNGGTPETGSFDGAFADSGTMTLAWDLPDGFSLLAQRLRWYNLEVA